MTVQYDYRVTVTCDNCGKQVSSISNGGPPPSGFPDHWIQGAPPGTTQQRDFCSTDCFMAWTPPVRPWVEEEVSNGRKK